MEGRIHGGAFFGSLRYTRLEAVVRTISTGRFVSIYFSIRRKEKFSSTDKFITKISWTLFFDPLRLMLPSRNKLITLTIADEQQKFKTG